MKEYYLELEKNNHEQAIEAVGLFEKLGYFTDQQINDSYLDDSFFTCVLTYSHGRVSIRDHVNNQWGHETITLQQLRELAS